RNPLKPRTHLESATTHTQANEGCVRWVRTNCRSRNGLRPHRFCRAHGSDRGHLCCRRCSAMVGRDDLCPCSARGHCSWHGRGHCRASKFQHGNSRLENSTSPSTKRDQKTRRDDPPPSGAAAKNTTASPG